MIHYLAAIITSPAGTSAFRLRRSLGRLRRIAASIEADDASGGTQAVSPHIHIADITEHGHTPPLDLLTDHAQALLIGLASHQHRQPCTVVVVDPEQAPSVAAQIAAARELKLDVQRPDAGRLARWELGPTRSDAPGRVDPMACLRSPESRALDSDDDQRCDRLEIRQLWQLLRCYYEGAAGVCGTGAIDYAHTGGGGGAYRARQAQDLVALQIAQAAAVMHAAQRDPRWRGLSRRGGGGSVALAIEDRRRAEWQTDEVVRLRYEGCSFADISVRAGCSVAAAKRTWSRAEAAIRDALAVRVALRLAIEAAGSDVPALDDAKNAGIG